MSRSSYAPYSSISPHTSPRPTPASPSKSTIPSSPPRKVVTDFAAFGAPKNASVFGTAVASTPFSLAGGKAAFGGMRPAASRTFEEDEEEEDDGRQRVELREGSISLDQVCGLCPYCCGIGLMAAIVLVGEKDCHAERLEECENLKTQYLGLIFWFPRDTNFNFSVHLFTHWLFNGLGATLYSMISNPSQTSNISPAKYIFYTSHSIYP
jgi:hypothetical protein